MIQIKVKIYLNRYAQDENMHVLQLFGKVSDEKLKYFALHQKRPKCASQHQSSCRVIKGASKSKKRINMFRYNTTFLGMAYF